MKLFPYFLTLALFVVLANHPPVGAQTVDVTYQESLENFGNPERGLPLRIDPPWPNENFLNAQRGKPLVDNPDYLGWDEIPWEFCERDEPRYTYTAWTEPLNLDELKQNRARGVTLVMVRYHLADFRREPLTKKFLERLTNDFNKARKAGVKLIPRFAYNYPKGGPDTSLNWVTKHLSQLKPVFDKHYDVIAFCDLGFIGCWGEGHTTANELMDVSRGYTRLNKASIQIINKFFSVLPAQRMIAVRYANYKFQYYNGLSANAQRENKPITPLTANQAYDESIRSRWGQHEDCFTCGEWNAGSWDNPHSVANGKAKEITDFLNADNRFVVQSGEVGAGCCELPDNPTDEDGDGWSSDYDACARVMPLLKKLRFSTFNHNDDFERVARWQDEGCFDELQRNLGYRLILKKASVPRQVAAQGTLNVSLTMRNAGWARPYNPRDVEIVLRSTTTGQVHRLKIATDEDKRLWLPGPDQTKTLTANVPLPPEVTPDDYALLLNLPDPAPRLNTRPDYSIRLANQDTWEAATGYNNLNTTITVTGESVVSTHTVRARGLKGTERMALQIGGETVKSWTVSKSMQNYSYSGDESGSVRVAITNDQGKGHDLVVDKLTVDGTVYEAKLQAINTGVWQNGSCGGSNSQWLHCGGYIEFDLGGANARQAGRFEKQSVNLEEVTSSLQVYPNPSQDGSFTLQGGDVGSAQVRLYNLQGQRIPVNVTEMRNDQLSLQIGKKAAGELYILHVRTNAGLLTKRLLITQ